jgi:hypothetical protein
VKHSLCAPLNFDTLKAKQRAPRYAFSEPLALRVHRAASWFARAVAEKDDADVRFILLWIGFNSAYADDIDVDSTERGAFKAYFDTRRSRADRNGQSNIPISRRRPPVSACSPLPTAVVFRDTGCNYWKCMAGSWRVPLLPSGQWG